MEIPKKNPNTTYKKIARIVSVSISTVGRKIKRYKAVNPLSTTPGTGGKKSVKYRSGKKLSSCLLGIDALECVMQQKDGVVQSQ